LHVASCLPKAGDILYILDMSEEDWWKARCKGREGLIPSNMVESTGDTSPLHDAAKRGNLELIRECLVNRLPVNQADPAGNTALHWAARTGHTACLQELTAVKQVAVDKQNKLGDTALLLAAAHGHSEAVRLLLEVGANTNLNNNQGRTVTQLVSDPDVAVVLKKWGVIQSLGKNSEFADVEYQEDEDDDE